MKTISHRIASYLVSPLLMQPLLLLGFASDTSTARTQSSGTFNAAGIMTTARSQHTATHLNNGRVLVTGATSGDIPGYLILNSAELYTPPVLVPAPVLFSLSGDGKGQGAIWHAETGQVASANSPAIAGEGLLLYTASLVDGVVIPPQVAIGGGLAEVLYFGNTPGYPGYNQVNFRFAERRRPGPAVPLRLTYLSPASDEITIGVH